MIERLKLAKCLLGTTLPFWSASIAMSAAILLSACGDKSGDLTRLDNAPVNNIWSDSELKPIALKAGAAIYAANCASCHTKNDVASGTRTAANLEDDFWLYGGEDQESFLIRPSDVETTVRFGIRSGHVKARNLALMPGTSDPKSPTHGLSGPQIDQLVEFVLHKSGQQSDIPKARLGLSVFNADGACFDCHSSDAKGDNSIGATDLTKPATWLHGKNPAQIRASITDGRKSSCPAFETKLSPSEIKAVSIYAYSKAKGYDF